MKLLASIFLSCASLISANLDINYKLSEIDNCKKELTVQIKADKDQIVYADSLDLSLDNPNLELSQYKLNQEPTKIYDADYQDYAQILKGNINLTAIVENRTEFAQNSNLFVSYQLNNSHNNFQEKKFSIDFFKDSIKDTCSSSDEEDDIVEIKKGISLWSAIEKLSDTIQSIVKSTKSTPIRLLFVFLLGILMSLTPCIYPMIPITAGVLQSQGTNSFFSNLLLSLSYTCGMATTFAMFGLTAAFTGHLFGQILTNPFFIIFLVLILAYLGFSMLGLYDMYIPKLMQTDNNSVEKKGSLLSIFIFGAVTGSVASPCISPGLALLLTIVATLGNKLLGFIMLFVFGIGLSLPLLIIGTFSSSINTLPQSGMWMIEIKKLFGFMLFGMCFYFLSNIVPYHILIWIISISIFATGIYYIKSISPYDSKLWKNIKNLIGFTCIALSILLFFKSINETFFKKPKIEDGIWQHDYPKALAQAKTENKKLLIDVGAEWCSICKAIDKLVFGNKEVQKELTNFVALKVDATNSSSEPYIILQKRFEIKGVPTILLVEPKTNKVLQRWDSRLYSKDRKEFIKELRCLAN
jgi:thioredoxin:protein disulfide reductase